MVLVNSTLLVTVKDQHFELFSDLIGGAPMDDGSHDWLKQTIMLKSLK